MDAGRTCARHLDRHRFACVDNRCFIAHRVPGMGLALAIPGECSACYLRTVDQARRRRDASLSRTGSKAAQVTSTNQRGRETTLAQFGVRLGPDVWYSLVVVFSLSYLATVLGLPRPLALISLSIGLVFNVLSEVFFGALSDRLGRRAVYGAGVILTMMWVFAFFVLLDTRQPLLITLAIVVALIAHAMMYGPQAAFITEQFPTRVQFAGSSMGYTLAGLVGGGIAPAIFATLLREFKTPFSIALYAAGALAITGMVLWFSRETAHASHFSSKD